MKTIVIVGGGYGGITLAKALEKQILGDDARILLVETKSHFYHNVAGLRAGVQDLDDRIFIPYSKLFTSSTNKVIHASVTRFDENAVYLDIEYSDFGKKISYDFLVIATGTRYPAPARVEAPTLEEGRAQIQHIRQCIREAKHILIVGGGPVGIEMAGEIRQVDQNKKVTLLHNGSQLGNPSYMPLKVHYKLLHLLESSQVQVILNDRVEIESANSVYLPSTPVHTKQGKDLSTVDLVMIAAGNKPDAGWVESSFPELIQNKQGFIKVKSTLQVDHPTLASKVFVIGDVAALNETKLAFRAAAHAAVAATNIARLLNAPDTLPESLKRYKKGPDMMLITYGKDKGVTLLPWGIVAGNWFSSVLKSKTLFIDRYWKELNQQ